MGYQGIEYLRTKLRQKQSRVNLRYNYYEMKNAVKDFNIVIPSSWTFLKAVLGWSAKAVDALADRLVFTGFGNDNFNLNEIFNMNSKDVFVDSSILSACIASCCFVYISQDENWYPRLQVIDGYDATGIIDDYTKLLTEGYAVLDRDEKGNIIREAYFTPGRTEIYEAGKREPVATETFKSRYCALVPIIYRPDSKRPFGHSRISRACMDYSKGAMRTLKRMEISAEFYSYPQKYVTGLSPDAEKMDKWKATMSAMMSFTKDEDGNSPNIGQFQAASMTPHIEQIKGYASMFAGETGLSLDDLGFVTSNPSSAESIKASHEGLRLTATKAQRCFGVGFKNVGYIGACIRDDVDYQREEVFKTKAIWKPSFEPDASMLSSIGDGVIKINQAIPGFVDGYKMRKITGIE